MRRNKNLSPGTTQRDTWRFLLEFFLYQCFLCGNIIVKKSKLQKKVKLKITKWKGIESIKPKVPKVKIVKTLKYIMKLALPHLIISCCHETYKGLLNEFMTIIIKKKNG